MSLKTVVIKAWAVFGSSAVSTSFASLFFHLNNKDDFIILIQCACVCCLTQDRKRYPKQEHSHSSQHGHEEVTGEKNAKDGDGGVIPAKAANGSLVLCSPDEPQEQQGDYHGSDKQLEWLEIPRGNRHSQSQAVSEPDVKQQLAGQRKEQK